MQNMISDDNPISHQEQHTILQKFQTEIGTRVIEKVKSIDKNIIAKYTNLPSKSTPYNLHININGYKKFNECQTFIFSSNTSTLTKRLDVLLTYWNSMANLNYNLQGVKNIDHLDILF